MKKNSRQTAKMLNIIKKSGIVFLFTATAFMIDSCERRRLEDRMLRPACSVIYDANGGIGGKTDNGLRSGSQYTIKTAVEAGVSWSNPSVPYYFIGWNTKSDGSGTSYSPSTVITLTENLKLYAQWAPPSYHSVTYDANGGSGGAIDSNLLIGSRYTVRTLSEAGVNPPIDPNQRTYRFIGWNTQPDGSGTDYAPGAVIDPLTGDIILYAQWEFVYSVTYVNEGRGGQGGPFTENAGSRTPYTVKAPSAAGISPVSGYAFAKWNTKSDGSGTDYKPGDIITVPTHITLYAQWSLLTYYSVTYDGNDGDAPPGVTISVVSGGQHIVLSDTAAGILLNAESKRFTGWNTSPYGNGTTYKPGAVITVTGNITLYAQWEEGIRVCYEAGQCYIGGPCGFSFYYYEYAFPSLPYRVKSPSEIGCCTTISWIGDFKRWSKQDLGRDYNPGDIIQNPANMGDACFDAVYE